MIDKIFSKNTNNKRLILAFIPIVFATSFFVVAMAQSTATWEKPVSGDTLSGNRDLVVSANPNSAWVRWCYASGNDNICVPSSTGTDMTYNMALESWTYTWDTTSVLNGNYSLCAQESGQASVNSQNCINVSVDNADPSTTMIVGPDGLTYEQRRQNWLAREGKTYDDRYTNVAQFGNPYLFAWFERGLYFGDTGPEDTDPKYAGVGSASEEIQKLLGPDWNAAGSLAQATGARLFYQYGDVLRGERAVNGNYYQNTSDYDDLNREMRNQVRQYGGLTARLGGPAKSCSTQPTRTIVSYVYTLTDTGATFTYDSTDPKETLIDWTGPYTGITYKDGGVYNSHKYTLDLLYNGFDECFAKGNNYELEGGHYTWTSVLAYLFLYDFADRICDINENDPLCAEGREVKQKAKMTLDLITLGEMMDFSAKQFGGSQGRTYRRQVVDSVQRFGLHNAWFGLPEKAPREAHGLAYVSSYYPSELIQKMVISPETEGVNYWHFNMENVNVANQTGQTGKWVFVTPNFNLGGSDTQTTGWVLNIKSSATGEDDYADRTGQPFRLWVDREVWTANKCGTYKTDVCNKPWGLGGGIYRQFRNIVFMNTSRMKLHVTQQNPFDVGQNNLIPLNEFDLEPNNISTTTDRCLDEICKNNYTLGGGWNFFREADVGIAMRMSGNSFGMEVVSLAPGCDGIHCYGSKSTVEQNFTDFKNAVSSNASLTYDSFTSSKGYTVSLNDTACGINAPGDCIFPFDRIEAIDNNNSKLIDWNNNTMTLSKDGSSCSYDYGNWSYSGNGCDNGYAGIIQASGPWPSPPPNNGGGNNGGGNGGGGNGGGGNGGGGNGGGTTRTGNADLNCDKLVNVKDLGIILSWKTSENAPYPNTSAPGAQSDGTYKHPDCGPITRSPDLNYNNSIDNSDLSILLSQWDTQGFTGTDPIVPNLPDPSGQPRISGEYPLIGWQTFTGAVDDFYSRFNLLVYRDDDEARVNSIKSLNPNIKIVWTFDWNAAVDIPGIPEEWQLKDTDGNPIMIYGNPGWPMMNMSRWGPKANGPYGYQTYREFVATHFERTADISVFDGWGTDGAWGRDNMAWAYKRTSNPDFSKVDANNNGINDHEEFTDDEWLDNWQMGMDELVSYVRANLDNAGNDKLLIINSGAPHKWSWPDTNGIITEKQYAYFDDEFNRRYWRDFANNGRKPLYSVADGLPDGKAPNLPANTKNDFRGMRFGLVTSMFNDVYYSFQSSEAGEHYWSYWYDEFDANLGKPLSSAQQIRPGLWVRFFDKGVAIASTNGQSQTVTDADLKTFSEYAGPYYRFFGGQDASFNNGSQFDRIVLKGDLLDGTRRLGDGIILFNQPTTIVSDIIIDNVDMGTSPSNVSASLTGFTQIGCNGPRPNISDFYTLRCGWNPGSYGYAESSTSGSVAKFTPQIEIEGIYNVYEWHGKRDSGEALCNNVKLSVQGGATCSFKPTVDQTVNPGKWNNIGTCTLPKGNINSIVLTAPGGCVTQADAMKFEYVEQNLE